MGKSALMHLVDLVLNLLFNFIAVALVVAGVAQLIGHVLNHVLLAARLYSIVVQPVQLKSAHR